MLNRYAEENNYATVVDSSAQNSPVLYASKNIDLTQDIIRLYDKAYPAKAAAPASKPAPSAPKPPATPPATKPQWVFVDAIGESTASVGLWPRDHGNQAPFRRLDGTGFFGVRQERSR